jgi:hypothetical protein
MLRVSPGPLTVVPSYTHAGPNHTDRTTTYLPRAKFSGLIGVGATDTITELSTLARCVETGGRILLRQ